jgi:hypothetical protein
MTDEAKTTIAEMHIDWDAFRPERPTKRRWGRPVFPGENPRPHEIATCKHCGMEFWRKPRGRPPLYCCDAHRDQARDRRSMTTPISEMRGDQETKEREAMMKRMRSRKCAACRQRFKPTRSDAKTCSATCRQRAHRRRVMRDRNLSRISAHFSSRTDLWSTPQELFAALDLEFEFTSTPGGSENTASRSECRSRRIRLLKLRIDGISPLNG